MIIKVGPTVYKTHVLLRSYCVSIFLSKMKKFTDSKSKIESYNFLISFTTDSTMIILIIQMHPYFDEFPLDHACLKAPFINY